MDCNKFYGVRIVRYKFMCDALNDLEASTSEKEHDIVLLPPASDNKKIESDEEDIDDEALSGSNLPQEVPGEIEIHQIDSGEDKDEDSKGNKSRKTKTLWKKSESLALQASIVEPPKVGSEHAGKSDEHLVFVKWNDHAIATVGSNYYGVTPLHKTPSRAKREHKKNVQQPNAIKKYIEGMGGVDLLDRPRLRSKKWWWNLFSRVLNLSVVAVYRVLFYIIRIHLLYLLV
ncbi:hypothetical protein ILUMI_02454 [Ignelater luminosus]|uniref:PiggyBac transposable element-derived protein domain-containing protein n=1 Tax=Ignelater luminosus TaxID=2038154 RepID=A0A8K0GLC0_IGNLU|nr:hypothetical protein ILUMI_02454 [Ignelater luminosus]